MENTPNFKVVIRIRPPLKREVDPSVPFQGIINEDGKNCTIQEYLGAEIYEAERQRDIKNNPKMCAYHTFTFDRVFGMGTTQSEVYEQAARPAVLSVLQGYNATMLAYG